MKVKIGLVQMGMSADKSRNMERALRGISDAAAKGANIVCLPELFTSPYFPRQERAEAEGYAEAVPGRTTDALSEAAKESGVVLVGGSLFEKDGKRMFNTTPVFDGSGKLVGKYRKMHIPHDPNFYEQNYFERGEHGLPGVQDTLREYRDPHMLRPVVP